MRSPMGFTGRNVNHVFPLAVQFFKEAQMTRLIAPRDPMKLTAEAVMPVASVYHRPRERVLFSPTRDANPFFHFFESLWILAGRNDVKWLSFFLSRMADFSDDGATLHGAYGARMRYVRTHDDFRPDVKDPLQLLIDELHHDRNTRRAVLGLWQPDRDAGYRGKDMPCNTTIFFKIRDGDLHMTVCCRSNDAIWGAYGANVVQFSTLQEYIAARVDANVGTYVQWSDSFHVYEKEPAWIRVRDGSQSGIVLDPYDSGQVASAYGSSEDRPVLPYPMVKNPVCWDTELKLLMEHTETAMARNRPIAVFPDTINSYFSEVAVPLFNAFVAYKDRDWDAALKWALMCAAEDWRLAAAMWVHRRRMQPKGA